MTQIIYDETGFVISQMQGSDLHTPVGVPYLEVEIPQGKYVTSINVSVIPNIPVFVDLPKSETQILQKQVFDLTTQLVTLEVI